MWRIKLVRSEASTLAQPNKMVAEMRTALTTLITAITSPRSRTKAEGSFFGGKDIDVNGVTCYRYRFKSKPAGADQKQSLLVRPRGSKVSWIPVSVEWDTSSVILRTDDSLEPVPAQLEWREDATDQFRKYLDVLDQEPASRKILENFTGRGTAVRADQRARDHVSAFDNYNPDQRRAVEQALASDFTAVWGPPGTGKTDVVAGIVEGLCRRGETVLFLAPTNVAVDQALERICARLENHPEFRRGLVRRIGKIEVDGLRDRFGASIDRDQTVARLAGPLDAEFQKLRERQRDIVELIPLHRAAAEVDAELRRAQQDASTQATAVERLAAELNSLHLTHQQTGELLHAARTSSRLNLVAKGKISRLEQELWGLTNEITRLTNHYPAAKAELDRRNAVCVAAGQKRTALPPLTGSLAQLESEAEVVQGNLTRIQEQRSLLEQQIDDVCRVYATTVTMAVLKLGRLPKPPGAVILDEAGMVVLPAAYSLAAAAHERFVAVGDFRQLGPVLPSELDELQPHSRRHVEQDVFSATGLLTDGGTTRNDPRLVQLRTQYRMHEEICGVINAFAYPDSPLTTGSRKPNDLLVSPILPAPLVLIDTSPVVAPGNRHRKSNPVHAAVIRELTRRLQFDGVLPARRADGAAPSDVLAVIAPYRDQKSLMSRVFVERFGSSHDNLVDTVHRFQGSQRPIVVVDTVEGVGGNLGMFFKGLGFQSSTCRLTNVAISRAQHHVVVLANLDYLHRTLPPLSEFRIMLDQVERRGTRLPVESLVPIRGAAELALLSHDERERPAFFPADEFRAAVEWELDNAQRRVELYSAFLSANTATFWANRLAAVRRRGVPVAVHCREPNTPEGTRLVEQMRRTGLEVHHRVDMHEKVLVVDDVLWHGSLNILQHQRSTELMMRFVSAEACKDVLKILENARPIRPAWNGGAGDRVYLPRAKYEHRQEVKAAGGQWDGGKKQWWVPKDKATQTVVERWG
ncbi:AAA domain-containing protein [Lentzea tibetensis]|uniref:AAA domain-containing protein n=1 Tax=Lentzea tibetensis TaxID=2591470 RepID=UPI001F217BB0|nr:AAA domain-containing protein [Lentzea tibetensis]